MARFKSLRLSLRFPFRRYILPQWQLVASSFGKLSSLQTLVSEVLRLHHSTSILEVCCLSFVVEFYCMPPVQKRGDVTWFCCFQHSRKSCPEVGQVDFFNKPFRRLLTRCFISSTRNWEFNFEVNKPVETERFFFLDYLPLFD